MKLSNPIQIDLKEIIVEGKFDYLKPGRSKEWVLNNFPHPDGYLESQMEIKDDVWLYGNIELHFHENELMMVYSDYLDQLTGGPSIQLNKRFLSNDQPVKLKSFIEILNEWQVDFSKHKRESSDSYVEIRILKTGLGCTFILPELEDENHSDYDKRAETADHNDFEWAAFSLFQYSESNKLMS